MAVSGHLLRTLASVTPGTRVVVAGGAAETADALVRLGLDVRAVYADDAGVRAARAHLTPHLGADEAAQRVTRADLDALGIPSDWADWAVLTAPPDLDAALAEAARVVRPGAWIWICADVPAGALDDAARRAGLAVAETAADEDGAARAVYRRPGGVG